MSARPLMKPYIMLIKLLRTVGAGMYSYINWKRIIWQVMYAKEALLLYKNRDDSKKLFRGDKSYLGEKTAIPECANELFKKTVEWKPLSRTSNHLTIQGIIFVGVKINEIIIGIWNKKRIMLFLKHNGITFQCSR